MEGGEARGVGEGWAGEEFGEDRFETGGVGAREARVDVVVWCYGVLGDC